MVIPPDRPAKNILSFSGILPRNATTRFVFINKPMFLLPRFLSGLTSLLLIAGNVAASSRIGIWTGDPSLSDLATLLTARLSKEPGVEILEREELSRILDEKKVQAVLTKEAVPSLPGVEALLFLTEEPGGGIRARFVACAPGIVLTDLTFPPDLGLEARSAAIGNRIRRHLPRINLLQEKALAISVLNLRSALGGEDWREIELRLTALLESRLAAEPGLFVLDRRTLDDLRREKSLDGDDSPFRGGVWLVEGSLEPRQPGTSDVRVNLKARRQQPPAEIAVTVDGSTGQISELANALGAELLQNIGAAPSAAAWNPLAEAEEFAREAVWARQCRQPELALAAANSARALGADSADLSAFRVLLLAEKLGIWNYDTDDAELRKIPEGELRERLALTREMLAELERDPPKQPPFLSSRGARGAAVSAGLKVLRQAVETSGPGSAEDLREKLRALAGFDPLHGRISKSWQVIYGFAEYLAKDAGELLAQQKGFLAATDHGMRFRVPAVLRGLRGRQENFIPPHLEPDSQKRQIVFDEFLTELSATPATALFALFVRCGGTQDPVERSVRTRKFLEAVYSGREESWANGWFPYLTTLATNFDSSQEDALGKPLSDLLLFYLGRAEKHDENTFRRLWKPARFPAASAPEIWKAFLAYKSRALSAARGESEQSQRNLRANFQYYAERFAEQFPTLPKAPRESLPTVRVTRYWQAGLENGRVIAFNYIRACGDHVVVPCGGPRRNGFHLVSVPSLESRRIESPVTLIDVLVTDDAIFPMSPNGGKDTAPLARFDLKTGTWTVQDAPAYHFQHNMVCGDQVFLKGYTDGNSSLKAYNWKEKTSTLLASNRRKPRQNQFDDRGEYFASSYFFPGPNHFPCVLIDGQPYRVRDEPGDWPSLFPVVEDPGKPPGFCGKFFWRLVGNGPRSLLLSKRGDLVLIDPEKPEPVPLAVSERTGGLFPQWAERAKWGSFSIADAAKFNDVFMAANSHGVFALHRKTPEDGGYFYLRWFRPEAGEKLVRLEFADPPALPGGIVSSQFDIQGNSVFARPQMHISDHGLIFATMERGFWFLPFSDLENASLGTPDAASD